MKIPRIMIGATGSKSGKTTFTCALLEILSDMKKKTAAFKCGPDYIDPLFHKKVLGVSSKNLDIFFTNEELTKKLFIEDSANKEISVIEGVMGLFDGLGGIKEEASSYHIAVITKTPIILVVNAYGMGRSLLSLIAGFLQYDRAGLIAGVILNKISKTFYESIKEEIERNLNVKVIGYIPNMPELEFESRHLGLKLPCEINNVHEKIKEVANIIRKSIDLPLLIKIAENAEELEVLYDEKDEYAKSSSAKVKIGVAQDEAFCFYYEDNFKLLQKMGAELCFFSPLYHNMLPKGLQGLILGGGYPEMYAEILSKNESMKKSIKNAIEQGLPSIAECGGFLYLHEKLEDLDGKSFDMVGTVNAKCSYIGRSVRFGYVDIEEKKKYFLKDNQTIKGHEFHYFDSTDNGSDCTAIKPVSGRNWDCIHVNDIRWWGFPHLYYYSNPQYIKHFIKKAKEYEKT